VKTVDEMLMWMNKGDKGRHVGATKMNQDSSRSHSIFTVYLEVEEKVDAKNSKIKAGKLNLVDLAGSER
jgi:kinesin family protein 3/17